MIGVTHRKLVRNKYVGAIRKFLAFYSLNSGVKSW